MFYVYRFLDKEKNIIYVGKSKQELEQRFKGHTHLPRECYDLVYTIEYIECATESDMSIKEIYYINKFRNDHIFFNLLDMTDVPSSVDFTDEWMLYQGPLESNFRHSINYIEGYTSPTKETRYNKDGTVDRRKPNSQKGTSVYVDGLTADEVNLIIECFIDKINDSENDHQEQLNFRNLVMFMLAINLPLQVSDFLQIKYKDLFSVHDSPKAFALQLGRNKQDEIINIPLRDTVKNLLVAYTKYYGYSFRENAEDSLFQSRKHQIITPIAWGRILKDVAKEVGIQKNVNGGSTKKTYGLNVYNVAEDKLNAILFLGEIWGQMRDATIIRYLDLTDETVDFDYYLGEKFSVGNVDLSKIKCLRPNSTQIPLNIPKEKKPCEEKITSSSKPKQSAKKVTTTYSKQKNTTDRHDPTSKHKPKPATEKIPLYTDPELAVMEEKRKNELVAWFVGTSGNLQRVNNIWAKEIKLEIVEKNLHQYIPQIVLAEEYGVPVGNISRWVSEYIERGESAFDDN